MAVNGEGEQGPLKHGGKVAGALIVSGVVLLDLFKRFSQLKHSCELMLAVITAEARASEMADFAILVLKLDLIGLAALNDDIATAPVEADIDTLFSM